MAGLTPVEQKIFEAWREAAPAGIKAEDHIDMIRGRIKAIAHHEAGHMAATAFFEGNVSHFEKITIIPTKDCQGFFRQSRIIPFSFRNFPGRIGWIRGQMAIIQALSGRMAEKRFDPYIETIDDAVNNGYGWELSDYPSEEDWLKKSDEGRVYEIANLMQKRGWPWYRILNMVEAWTDDFLNIPIVWQTVKNIAARLLDAGGITDFDEYYNLINPIVFNWPEFPEWNRRFNIKTEEYLKE